MLIPTILPRKFKMTDRGTLLMLDDPNPTLSPERVLMLYANTYPILTTAKVSGPELVNDTVQFTFSSVMGTKG